MLRTHLDQFCAPAVDARVFTSTTRPPPRRRPPPAARVEARRELAFPKGHRLHTGGRYAFRHLAVARWRDGRFTRWRHVISDDLRLCR